MNWRQKALATFLILMPALNGCVVDVSEPDLTQSAPLGLEVTSESAKLQAGLDSVILGGNFNYYASKSYRTRMEVSTYGRAEAFIDHPGITRVNIFDVALEGNSNPGFYTGGLYTYSAQERMKWSVEMSGSDILENTSTNVQELSIKDLLVADTVDRSEGFTVNYLGAAGGDLEVVLAFDHALTFAWGDSALAEDENTQGFLKKTIDDNGQIHFSKEELESFTPGGYIHLSFSHWVYHIIQLAGWWPVGIYRSYSVDIPLFLKP